MDCSLYYTYVMFSNFLCLFVFPFFFFSEGEFLIKTIKVIYRFVKRYIFNVYIKVFIYLHTFTRYLEVIDRVLIREGSLTYKTLPFPTQRVQMGRWDIIEDITGCTSGAHQVAVTYLCAYS